MALEQWDGRGRRGLPGSGSKNWSKTVILCNASFCCVLIHIVDDMGIESLEPRHTTAALCKIHVPGKDSAQDNFVATRVERWIIKHETC